MADAIGIDFDPLLNPWTFGAIALVAVLLVGWGLRVGASGIRWRALAMAVFLLTLANPTLVRETREPRADVAVLVVDDSASQGVGDRAAVRDRVLADFRASMQDRSDLEVRVVRVEGTRRRGTRLFDVISRERGDIPDHRLAAIVAITDGQVHDADASLDGTALPAPFHLVLTGRRDEDDRRIVIEQAPTFGMVGHSVGLTFRVEDPGVPPDTVVPVSVLVDGEPFRTMSVPVQRKQELAFELTRAGETIVEIEVAERSDELGTVNNRIAHAINAVRDRLRVLLVSGTPHAGERTWRSLLKADPAVDLVHFTVLRPAEKQDGTPVRELSLIPFPARELFELKIDGFDLIVLDHYHRRGVVPRVYLANIVNYVRSGGALLAASGPMFAGRFSIAATPIGEILPSSPLGNVIEAGFRPRITEQGFRHPVTAGLPGGGEMDRDGVRISEANWGRWLRQVEAEVRQGDVLFDGVGGRPLLMLARIGDGRVAQLLSDHVWLWSRGYEGGGPQAELLRRLAHWLMKEPALEENDLRATVTGQRIEIIRRSMDDAGKSVTMTAPGGHSETRELERIGIGTHTAVFEADRVGLYRFSDGELVRLVALGDLNDLEFARLQTTADIVGPVARATGGGVFWAGDDGTPDVRRVRPGRAAAGRGWLGLRANEAHDVTGVHTTRLLPEVLALVLLLGSAILAWRREAD